MTDRPIIFSGPMVRALLDGRKTQTRRVIKLPTKGEYVRPDMGGWAPITNGGSGVFRFGRDGSRIAVPETVGIWNRTTGTCLDVRYQAGDRLWVREAYALLPRTAYRGSIGTGTIDQREHPTDGYSAAVFREDFDRSGRPLWRPSIHMPRWASRLTLLVTEVRVQRLQEISEEDAIAEGAPDFGAFCEASDPGALNAAGETASETATRLRWSQRWYSSLWNSLHGPDAWDANPWVAAITFTVHRTNIDALAPADARDIAGAA